MPAILAFVNTFLLISEQSVMSLIVVLDLFLLCSNGKFASFLGHFLQTGRIFLLRNYSDVWWEFCDEDKGMVHFLWFLTILSVLACVFVWSSQFFKYIFREVSDNLPAVPWKI